MSGRTWSIIAAAFLAACILLGGASAAGALANAFLQMLSIAVILGLAWARRITIPAQARPLLWIVLLYLLFVLASLVPLPWSVWSSLPYRGELAAELRMIGIESGSLAASLAPSATIWSLLSLLPATAMFLLTTSLSAERRNLPLLTLIALAIGSIALGAFQLLGGPTSQFRFYAITNEMSAVGWFANVNHNATLVLCALPCLAALAARFAGKRDRSRRSGGVVMALASAAFLVLGIGLMRSVAGYALVLPALFAGLLIYRRAIVARITAGWRIAFAALAVVFIGVALLGPLSQERLSSKFNESPTSRKVIAEVTITAATPAFPLGTGLGSFVDVYRRFQEPAAASREYVNHAHNDYLEVAMELGAAGLLLVAGFILWWLRRALVVWREEFANAAAARAGSVIVGLVLLHSLVDYPIRTAAIAAVFAMGCALIVPARPSRREREGRGAREAARHLKVTGDEA